MTTAPSTPQAPYQGQHIGLLVGDFSNPYALEIVKTTRHVAQCDGYSVDVAVATEDPGSDVEAMRNLIASGAQGLLLATLPTAESKRELQHLSDSQEVPVALIGRDDGAFDSVSADVERGGELATTHLLELGHAVIGFIGAEFSDAGRVTRLLGYLSALQRAGHGVRPKYIVAGRGDGQGASYATREAGASAMQQLLNLPEPPTAVVARNDRTAFGAIDTLERLGVSVPQQMSIVGFDNSPMCNYSLPPLTSVDQATSRQTTAAAEFLMSRVLKRDHRLPPRRLTLQCSLVIRQSTSEMRAKYQAVAHTPR